MSLLQTVPWRRLDALILMFLIGLVLPPHLSLLSRANARELQDSFGVEVEERSELMATDQSEKRIDTYIEANKRLLQSDIPSGVAIEPNSTVVGILPDCVQVTQEHLTLYTPNDTSSYKEHPHTTQPPHPSSYKEHLPTVSCDDMFEMSLTPVPDSVQCPPGPRIYKPEISRISKFRRPSTQDMVASAEVAAAMTPSETAELPFLIYLPGIDGTGLAAYRQFPELCKNFDLHALFIPPEDRSGFESLAMLQAEISQFAPERPVYLLGESFGGLMCLALAQQMPEVDRIILVNPATNYSSSAWPDLGPLLTSLPGDFL
eukprot:gene391-1787_t